LADTRAVRFRTIGRLSTFILLRYKHLCASGRETVEQIWYGVRVKKETMNYTLGFCGAGGVALGSAQKVSLSKSCSAFAGNGAAVARTPARARSAERVTPRCAIARPERYKSHDWIRNLASLPRSSILTRIRTHIFTNVACSAGVFALFKAYPEWIIWHMSPQPHAMLGTVMGLLLVFRTNAAYDRFWEARKLLGALVNRTRAFCVASTTYFPSSASGNQRGDDSYRALCQLTIAFVHTFMLRLRGEDMDGSDSGPYVDAGGRPLSQWLPVDIDKEELLGMKNQPLFVCDKLQQKVREAFDNAPVAEATAIAQRETLDKYIGDFIDILGACERIILTPVPLSYSRHTSRFLSLWCVTLPIFLVEKQDFMVIVTSLFISWALFSIEEIGHLIEDPFIGKYNTTLPLEQMSTNLTGDLATILERAQVRDRGAVPPPPVRQPVGAGTAQFQ